MTNYTVADANAAHEASQAIVDAFLAAKPGNKITIPTDKFRPIVKETINRKAALKALVGMSNLEKFTYLIKRYHHLTRDKIETLTGGMDRIEIFRAARVLQDRGIINRSAPEGKGMGRQVQFNLVLSNES